MTSLIEEETGSAFPYLRFIARKGANILDGRDRVDEFFSRLFGVNQPLLVEDGQGLRMDSEEPRGTLFLDEFGDLPIEVQLLLLRYLESHEVQPVGSPHKILNVKTRIIVATSDPRVAAFMGSELTGSWRSRLENERPIRADLLFRIKTPPILVAAVTPQNALEEIVAIIEEKGNRLIWLEPVRKHLAAAVGKHLTKGGANDTKAAFGHRRELSRIIKLCEIHVNTAFRRGLRSAPTTVTNEIVDQVWKPSTLIIARGTSKATSDDPSVAELSDDERKQFEELIQKVRTDLAGVFTSQASFDGVHELKAQLEEALRFTKRADRLARLDKCVSILKRALTAKRKGTAGAKVPHAVYWTLFSPRLNRSDESPGEHLSQLGLKPFCVRLNKSEAA